jgi:hypothetical protein
MLKSLLFSLILIGLISCDVQYVESRESKISHILQSEGTSVILASPKKCNKDCHS